MSGSSYLIGPIDALKSNTILAHMALMTLIAQSGPNAFLQPEKPPKITCRKSPVRTALNPASQRVVGPRIVSRGWSAATSDDSPLSRAYECDGNKWVS